MIILSITIFIVVLSDAFFSVMLSVIERNVVLMNGILLNVIAPQSNIESLQKIVA